MNTLEHMHELLAALELALLEAGWWGEESPDEAALASTEPFCVDTLRFSEWLQWVYIPKMRAYIASQGALPERSDELVRIVLLLDALPTAEMEVLTPRDLPSIHWLRTHRAHAGGVALVRACAAAGMPLSGVELLQAQTEGFARTVVREGAIATLLSSVEALPSAREYAEPAAWLARVR